MEQRILGNQNVQIQNVQSSTITITTDGGPRRTVPLEPAWIELGADVTSPARLLKARHGVVPYVPPGDLAARLAIWSHEPGPFSVRVLAGMAGAGKTRIAVELCRTLSELRWLTGLLKAQVDPEGLDVLGSTPTARLVVVDYAETRQKQLAEALPVLAGLATVEHPVRVLLTVRSRTEGVVDVRRALQGHGEALDVVIDGAGIDLLSDLRFGEAEHGELFATAVDAFSRRLGRNAEAAQRLLPDLPDRALTSALMVLIAGYLAVTDGRVPTDRRELLEGVLEHEDRYWLARAAGLNTDPTLRRRVVALATLAGARPSEAGLVAETAAADLLRLVPDLTDASVRERREVARWVHGLYPGTGWWNPVEPDLVGEHLVATTYGNRAEVLAGALRDRPSDALVQPLRLLARAARDYPEMADTLAGVITERIADLCRVAVEQASGVDAPRLLQTGTSLAIALEALVSVVPADSDQLPEVLAGFPPFNMVLGSLTLTLTSQLVDHRRRLAATNPAAFEPDLARALNHLGIRLSYLGRRGQALAATEEAVEIQRRLAVANPAAFEPDLAQTLCNLGNHLSDLGRREQALRATEEAVAIQRRLTVANPAAFEPDLAGSLRGLGNRLSALGRREQALAASDEAVEIYRRLAAGNPTAFEPDLAIALNNVGADLSDLGRREQALAATEEAVELYRGLTAANPAAFEPNLAGILNNVGRRLSDLGRRERALAATEEAIEIYRRLVAANPAASEPNLAMALTNLGMPLSDLGRWEQALAATGEAVEIYRRLAAANPAAFEPELTHALNNLGVCLSELGRQEQALKATEEAVGFRRRLAAANPTAFEPNLATALTNLGLRLSELGRHEQAIQAIEEAVEIHRRLAAANPAAFEPELARSLWGLASVCAAGQIELKQALVAIHEAVHIYTRLARQLRATFTGALRDALSTLADVLDGLDRHDEAVEVRRSLDDLGGDGGD